MKRFIFVAQLIIIICIALYYFRYQIVISAISSSVATQDQKIKDKRETFATKLLAYLIDPKAQRKQLARVICYRGTRDHHGHKSWQFNPQPSGYMPPPPSYLYNFFSWLRSMVWYQLNINTNSMKAK